MYNGGIRMSKEIWELIKDLGAGKYYGRLRELNEKLQSLTEE